jgi:type IV pilus assembly protein PilE
LSGREVVHAILRRVAPFGSRFQPLVAGFCGTAGRSLASIARKGGFMSSSRGFTILELMIVVVIIAILAAIAIPSYSDYITRGKIQEASSILLAQRVKMEQYYQDQRTYVGACAAGTVAPLPVGLKYFTISCTNLTATTYTITATGGCLTCSPPDGSMTGFAFTINEGNTRQTTSVPGGWTLPGANCWVTRKGGTC